MYRFQARPYSSQIFAAHEASIGSNSQEAQNFENTNARIFRFSTRYTGLLQTILACSIFFALSSTSLVAAASAKQHGKGASTNLPTLSALSCSSASMTGPGTDSCTVTLTAAAPGGGISIGLSSSNSAVTVPTAVTVPNNATSVGFTATVSSVSSTQSATLTASANGTSKSFALQLNAYTPTLSINATSIAFGNVVVNTAVTQSVTLTSTGTGPVTISAAKLTGTGFTLSGPTFPLTLNPSQTATLNVQFDPATSGAATGQLTITSNSSTNGTAVISLSGTGEVLSHQVDLTWNAPSSPSDPIAGYNVYRSSNGGSSYQRVNSSEVTQTTYLDASVQSGLAYKYVVKSVDSSGVESAPSNTTSVTIP